MTTFGEGFTLLCIPRRRGLPSVDFVPLFHPKGTKSALGAEISRWGVIGGRNLPKIVYFRGGGATFGPLQWAGGFPAWISASASGFDISSLLVIGYWWPAPTPPPGGFVIGYWWILAGGPPPGGPLLVIGGVVVGRPAGPAGMWTARRAGRRPAGPMVSHEARRAEITLLATLLVTPGVPASKETNNVTNNVTNNQ